MFSIDYRYMAHSLEEKEKDVFVTGKSTLLTILLIFNFGLIIVDRILSDFRFISLKSRESNGLSFTEESSKDALNMNPRVAINGKLDCECSGLTDSAGSLLPEYC